MNGVKNRVEKGSVWIMKVEHILRKENNDSSTIKTEKLCPKEIRILLKMYMTRMIKTIVYTECSYIQVTL